MRTHNALYRPWLLLILPFLFDAVAVAQSYEEIVEGSRYYWGIGTGTNHKSASDNAMADLVSSIAAKVEVNFQSIQKELNGEVIDFARQTISTYSNAYLSNVQRKLLRDTAGLVEVMIFIEKKKAEQFFETRVDLINGYIEEGLEAESDNRIGAALQYYYWAFMLLRTYPDFSRLRHKFGGENEQPVNTRLQGKIKGLLQNIRIDIHHIEYDETRSRYIAHLQFSFNGSRISYISFTPVIQGNEGLITNALDGAAVVEIPETDYAPGNKITFRIEYLYFNELRSDEILRLAYEKIERYLRSYDESKIIKVLPVLDDAEEEINASLPVNASGNETSVQPENAGSTAPVDHESICMHILDEVLESIPSVTYKHIRPHFTDHGFDIFERMIAAGKVIVIATPEKPDFFEYDGQFVVRSVPMEFHYVNNNRKFAENVCFYFDSDHKIDAIAFTISDLAIRDIMARDKWDKRAREKIIQFMEDYKTAYCLKRTDFIESLFADNALIYVGHMLKDDQPVENKVMLNIPGNSDWQLIKLSKKEYMQRLRLVFRSNEYVNLRFEDNTFRKKNDESQVYGIQIHQFYHSSTYSDEGYLFLMIDFNDTLQHPVIYVRTWQPEKNADGSVIGLEDFTLN